MTVATCPRSRPGSAAAPSTPRWPSAGSAPPWPSAHGSRRDAFGEALLAGCAGGCRRVVRPAGRRTDDAGGRVDRRGRLGRVLVLRRGHGRPALLGARPTPAGTRAVSFGTCSLVLEPGASAYEELMRSAVGPGRVHRARPEHPGRPHPRPGRVPGALQELAPVDRPAQAVRGGRAVAGRHPAEWLASGPAAVVITQGGDGLTVFTRDGARVRRTG